MLTGSAEREANLKSNSSNFIVDTKKLKLSLFPGKLLTEM
jgi:hypothetical protein